MKPSKGPWRVEPGFGNCACGGAYGVVENGDYAIVTVWADVGELASSAAANANLIAAAPDLLKALKQCEAWVILGIARDPETTHPQAIQNAKDDHAALRAAIAKAEGK